MIFLSLPDDILCVLINQINIKCHTCNRKYKLDKGFFKKQQQFYYCSQQCYDFI